MIIAKRYCIISGQMKKRWCGSMAEQLIRNEQVDGSIPFTSSKKTVHPLCGFSFLIKSHGYCENNGMTVLRKRLTGHLLPVCCARVPSRCPAAPNGCSDPPMLFGGYYSVTFFVPEGLRSVPQKRRPSFLSRQKKSPFGKAVHALAKRRLF